MYSRYPLYEPDEPISRSHDDTHKHTHVPQREPEHSPLREERKPGRERPGIFGNLGGLGGLVRNLKLDWDSGDILLVLIILFLSTESDDTEIIILLGLLLVMGI